MPSPKSTAFLAGLLVLAGCTGAPGSLPGNAAVASAPLDLGSDARLTVSPNPAVFTSVGQTKLLTIRETNFSGKFTIAVPAKCDRVAFLRADLNGPVGTVEVHSVVSGTCDLMVTGGGERAIERVVIAARG